MFKNVLAASAFALAALPAAAATLNDAVPSNATIGSHIYVATTGEVVVTYIGSDASYTNLSYFVKSGADQPLFNNITSGAGTTVSLGSFTAGTELVFTMTSIGNGVNYFTTGTTDAKAGVAGSYGFVVAFEDIPGGDNDYNDLVFGVSNATSSLPAVPVPAALPLIASAFGGLALLRRRRRA
ncbi:MAG TPA: DUF4114 domain-containing protein [Paenirhodobacter sp.]